MIMLMKELGSRAAYYENQEQNISYITQIMESKRKTSVIKKLMTSEGQITFDKTNIIQEIKTFYINLYMDFQVRLDILNDDFSIGNLSKLDGDARESCEGIITVRECLSTLNEIKGNKAPGNDGLSVEFYLTFLPVLGDLVLDAFNEAYELNELAASPKQAVITLIQKEGKDPLFIKKKKPKQNKTVDQYLY